MGQKRKKLCSVLSAFILCMGIAAAVRILAPPAISRAAEKEEETPRLIYVDAGHGGFDVGANATLADGRVLLEKELVLAVARESAVCLQRDGFDTLLSRRDDERLTYTTARDELYARRAAAKEAGAALLLSIHANAYQGAGRAHGVRVYYNPACPASRALGEAVADALSSHTEELTGLCCRLVADGSYYVLGDTDLPALLIELGFLSDAEEAALLADSAYQARLAAAIAEGVKKSGL